MDSEGILPGKQESLVLNSPHVYDVHRAPSRAEAPDKVVEEIEVNLPIIDHYISLLRTEIDDLKAGKLDHCLREVVATPLIDPKLHLALSKAIDGGLLLPPPPNLSDSESEGEREGQEGGEDEEEEEEEDKETGKIAQGKEEEEDEAAYTDGKGAAAGGGMASGEEQKGDNDNEKVVGEINGGVSRQPCDKRGSDGAPHPRDGNRNSDGDEATELTATATVKTSGIENDRTPPHTERMTEVNGLTLSVTKPSICDNQGSSVTQNGTSARSDGSPLRDRPPVLSGGGSRVAPAAPPPQPPPPPFSECAKSGLTGDSDGRNGGIGVDEGKDGSREQDEGSPESAMRHVAGGAAAIVVPEMKSAKKKPGGDDPGSEVGGKEGDNQHSSKLGRKRGRAKDSESCATSPRHRISRPRRRDEEESADDEGNGGGDKKRATNETETVKKERGDSFDEEQFRRIALEVWDRVYKHKFAIIFRKPVNPKDAPGYEKVIKRPMDLALMKRRIMSGALMSLDDLSRDLFVMCNNAMVFNGKGDPYFDYSKELRTYASEVISEARRPGFVTADPGFDSIVAGTRFSRARQPSPCPSVTPRSAPRGRGRQKRKNGTGNGGGRRSSRDSDSTSVADDTGDEGGKVRRGRGRAGECANGKKRGRKRGSANSKSKGKSVSGRRGARSQESSEAESVGGSSLWVSSSEEDCDYEWEKGDGESASRSKSPCERGTGRKRTAGGKVTRCAKEGSCDSSDEDRSPRGKVRKGEKPAAKRTSSSKMSAGKKKGH